MTYPVCLYWVTEYSPGDLVGVFEVSALTTSAVEENNHPMPQPDPDSFDALMPALQSNVEEADQTEQDFLSSF